MKAPRVKPVRCAIYTRVSTEHGLDQEFNSLDAQYDADAHGVSFVSVTQQFNTTTSMGRLTLNVLLSFAQFKREVTSERIRDKIAASKRKGLWVGGNLPLGYKIMDCKIAIVEEEAELVRSIFRHYLEARHGCRGPCEAFRGPDSGARWQGDDRVHEPPYLRGSL
jgi:DNA invertase Pin-like site-specific DNA recombinase